MLNPEILHKVKAKTVTSGDKQTIVCYVDEKKSKVNIDHRGKKKKFWISDEENSRSYLIKYEDRDTRSLENAGQFIMCGVFDQLGLKHAEYLVCDFKFDGVSYDAIMSKNYRRNADIVELSGFTLNDKYKKREFDNNMGVLLESRHNVKAYMEILRNLYGRNAINFDKIEQSLKEYCLIQYIFMMSDLHFYNLSFMYDEKLGHKSLEVVPYYDCGNICSLNLSKERVQNILNDMKKTRKKTSLIDGIYHKKMPLFGLESDICVFISEKSIEKCVAHYEIASGKEKEEIAKIDLEILRNELAIELLRNPELNLFYERIKNNIDFNQIFVHYNSIKPGIIPDYALEVVKEIYNNNIKQLDKIYVENRIKILTGDKQEKTEEREK